MSDTVAVNINLEEYSDNHFMNKLNEDLDKMRDKHILRIHQRLKDIESNSPVSTSSRINISNPSSDSEDDDCFEEGYLSDEQPPVSVISFSKPPLKKLTFREVRDSIHKYYEMDDKYSSELDIVSTFLKGQKHMVLKAADITQLKTNLVLIPAALGSITITIFSLLSKCSPWSGGFLAGLNSFVCILYFMNVVFKWESSSLLYRQWAIQIDKLEQSFDLSDQDKEDCVLDILRDMEKRYMDLKETMTESLPIELKTIYPILYNVNIFTFIKKIELYKKNLIVKFKDIKNEIRYIQWRWSDNLELKGKTRLNFLYKIKEKIKGEILHYKNAYGSMDEMMIKELKRSGIIGLIYWSKKMNIENPVVASYFSTIFEDD